MTLNGPAHEQDRSARSSDPIEAADRLRRRSACGLYLVKEVAFGGDGDFSRGSAYDEAL